MQMTVIKDTDPTPARQPSASLITFLSLLALILALSFRMTAPYLLAVVMGGLLAIVTYPLYQKLRLHTGKPTLASAIVTVGLILLIIGPFSLILKLAVQQGAVIGEALSQSDALSVDSVRPVVNRFSSMVGVWVTRKDLNELVRSVGKTASATVLDVAKNIPQTVLQLALAAFACFFFLRDGKKFLLWLCHRVPLDPDIRTYVSKSFYSSAVSSVWASMAAATAQSAIMMAGFGALQIPGAFFAGAMTFVFAWIPLLGVMPVWGGGMVYLYLQGAYSKMAIMLVVGMIAGIIDNFVRAFVLRGRTEIHPLIGLVSIFGGISMFGIAGVFVGPVLVAILISFLQVWPVVGRRFGLDMDGEPDEF